MRPHLLIYLILISELLLSCKTEKTDGTPANHLGLTPYKITFNPSLGQSNNYDIVSTIDQTVENNGQTVNTNSKTDALINFIILKKADSNFSIDIKYRHLKVYMKDAKGESELDGDAGLSSSNPEERLLAIVKDGKFNAIVTPNGQIIAISGYKELKKKMIAQLDPTDVNTRNLIESQLDQIVGDGMLKKNLSQFFSFFPDSIVYAGDRWKKIERKNEGLPLVDSSTFWVEEIDNENATIQQSGEITSDGFVKGYMGSEIKAHLKGEGCGSFKIKTKTGFIENCSFKSKISGTLEVSGTEVPVNIETTLRFSKNS